MFADPWLKELYDRSKDYYKLLAAGHLTSGFSILNDNAFSEWLYEDNWSETKLRQYELLDAVPIIHQYMDYLLSRRSDQEYLDRYGMDYSDIHDPRKLRQSSAASTLISSGVNFVSDNISRLYR